MWTVRMYLRLLGTHLRAALQYEADFWIMIVAALLSQGVGLAFLAVVFARVPQLNGWSFWQVALMYAMVTLSEGVGSLLFEGTWRLAGAINGGDLDYMLIRPFPVVLQVTSSAVGFNGLGNIVLAGATFAVALPKADVGWSPNVAILAVLLLLGAVVIKLAINLATNATAFWLHGPNPVFAYAAHQVGELARYPLGIFPGAVRVVLTVGLPFAFTSYYPVSYLSGGADRRLGTVTPFVAVGCVLVALLVFRQGLRRYDSAGG